MVIVTDCIICEVFLMYKQLLSLVLCLIFGHVIQAMDYPPAPFVDITTINPYEIEELDGILDDNVILQEAKKGAVSGATGALTSNLISNGALFIASRVGKGEINIYQMPLDIASATFQGAADGWQVGLQKGVIDEIESSVPEARKELVKALLKDGVEGVTTGVNIACQNNDNVIKGAAIGGVCGAASGVTKIATRNAIAQKIAEQGPVASVANGVGEASIDYVRNAAIKTSMECTKDVSCVIS